MTSLITHWGNNMSSKFDILIDQVNGLTRMKEKPKTWEQQIQAFINDQVDQGIESFEVMDEIDKDRLCTLMTQNMGRDRYMVIMNIDDIDGVISELLYYINNYSREAAYDLAETMRLGLWAQFESDANDLFEEITTDRLNKKNREHGLSPHVDSINGETHWYK